MDIFDRLELALQEEFDGWTLRDADLEDVAHYFVYNADHYAEAYLS